MLLFSCCIFAILYVSISVLVSSNENAKVRQKYDTLALNWQITPYNSIIITTFAPFFMIQYPFIFHPNLQQTVWGGTRIKPLKGLDADTMPIGESWEISGITNRESVISNGALAGLTLTEAISQCGAELLGSHIYKRSSNNFPLLVKIIDAARDLSIQVHPNEQLARQRHGEYGKTEMWYVMNAEPGASLLLGFNKAITPEEYHQRVLDGTITDVLARHEVKTGDVFFIPAGRVHAICGGIMVCEIQQSSDITYRIFDYNRVGLDGKPRQLHIDEAKEALDYRVYPTYRTEYTHPENGAVRVVDCPYFAVNVVCTNTSLRRDLMAEDSFVTLTCLDGQCSITTDNGNTITLPYGSSCLIPAVAAHYTITATGQHPVRLLEAWAR